MRFFSFSDGLVPIVPCCSTAVVYPLQKIASGCENDCGSENDESNSLQVLCSKQISNLLRVIGHLVPFAPCPHVSDPDAIQYHGRWGGTYYRQETRWKRTTTTDVSVD